MRRLSINLVYTFWGAHSPEGTLAASFFSNTARWTVDEDMLYAAQGALGVTLASEPGAMIANSDEAHDAGVPQKEGAPTDLTAPGIHGSADFLTLANSFSGPDSVFWEPPEPTLPRSVLDPVGEEGDLDSSDTGTHGVEVELAKQQAAEEGRAPPHGKEE